jgi:uncharacterized protein (UPF0335 family)
MGKMKQEWQKINDLLENMTEEQLEDFVFTVERLAEAKKGGSLHEPNENLQ